jgi:hypothetical protein
MSAIERPAPPENAWADEGYEYVAVVHEKWRLVSGKRCRLLVEGRKGCGEPSVAEFNRSYSSRRENWWAYCPDHLYGNWIEGGQVMHWILRKVGES